MITTDAYKVYYKQWLTQVHRFPKLASIEAAHTKEWQKLFASSIINNSELYLHIDTTSSDNNPWGCRRRTLHSDTGTLDTRNWGWCSEKQSTPAYATVTKRLYVGRGIAQRCARRFWGSMVPAPRNVIMRYNLEGDIILPRDSAAIAELWLVTRQEFILLV